MTTTTRTIIRLSQNGNEEIGWFEAKEDYTPKDIELEGKENDRQRLPEITTERNYEEPTVKKFVETSLILGKRREATEEVTKYILNNNIIKTIRNDKNAEMWIYKEGIYIPEAKSYINEICRSLFGEGHTTHLLNEVIAKISAETYIDEKEFYNKQNENPYLLPVLNGILNLKTRELLPFTHEIPFFVKINATYDEEADCPRIKKFLGEILAEDDDIKIIQEMIGFGLVRDYKFEKSFMLYGQNGRNGKSKLLDLITRFYGAANVTSMSLHTIEQDRFSKARLQNKLMNIGADIPNEAIKNTSEFKGLTGRDLQTADRKFLNPVEFVNYAKFVFACNELPPVYTESDSFWLRWVFIDFPYQFLPKDVLIDLSESEKEYVKLQNPNLMEELVTTSELNGFLNFALKGLERLEKNKEFSTSKNAQEVKMYWLRKSNSVAAFIQDHILESDYDVWIAKSDFVKKYQIYCKTYRLKMVSEKMIKRTLINEIGVGETKKSENGERIHAWTGISFK